MSLVKSRLKKMDALKAEMKLFTCIWKIKNFSFSCDGQICVIDGPSFLKNGSGFEQLSLKLRLNRTFLVCDCAVRLPLSVPVNCELAFLTHDGTSLNHVEIPNVVFKDYKDRVLLPVDLKTVFGEDRIKFLPNDTLTVQCKIWAPADSGLEAGQISAETEIEVQRISLVWNIENFTWLFDEEKKTRKVVYKSKPFCNFLFYLKQGVPFIERNPLNTQSKNFCKCQFFLVDATGKKNKCGTQYFLANQRETVPLSLMTENLFRNSSQYLPNDTLTLQYEIEFSTGRKFLKILKPASKPPKIFTTTNSTQSVEKFPRGNSAANSTQSVEKFPCGNSINSTANSTQSVEKFPRGNSTTNSTQSVEKFPCGNSINSTANSTQSEEKFPCGNSTANSTHSREKFSCGESSLSWKDDLLCILKNGFLFDTCLKTTSYSFAVHSLILRIRSPVFADKLTACDCEGLKEGIHIEKMKSNTLRKFILFLYTDTLPDLDWANAESLYIASHEYEITYLKNICTSFLKSNLDCNNCCEILYMADKYQDYDLVSAVQCFITEHANEILVSEAWRNLEESNSLLTSKTLRKLYLEN